MNKRLRWLAADELDAWIRFAAVMNRLPANLDADMRAAAGVSQFEYVVLSRLSEAPRRVLQLKHLAVLANGSPSRLSHVLSRLEHHGWLVRSPLPGNGRITVATLTESGWSKVVASAPAHLASVRRHVMDLLSQEQVGQLRSVMGALSEAWADEIRLPVDSETQPPPDHFERKASPPGTGRARG